MEREDSLRRKQKKQALFLCLSKDKKLIEQIVRELKFSEFMILSNPSKKIRLVNPGSLLFVVCDYRFRDLSLIEDLFKEKVVIEYFAEDSENTIKMAFLKAFFRINYPKYK
jgi:hypothetical protein